MIWISKLWLIRLIEYYMMLKRNEFLKTNRIMSFPRRWMEWNYVQTSKTQRHILFIFCHVESRFKKKKKSNYLWCCTWGCGINEDNGQWILSSSFMYMYKHHNEIHYCRVNTHNGEEGRFSSAKEHLRKQVLITEWKKLSGRPCALRGDWQCQESACVWFRGPEVCTTAW